MTKQRGRTTSEAKDRKNGLKKEKEQTVETKDRNNGRDREKEG